MHVGFGEQLFEKKIAIAGRPGLQGRRIGGVVLSQGGMLQQVRAADTIVAAGALQSPAMLLRAGIGPADELDALGIAVLADLPGTGRNLRNHPRISLSAYLKPPGRQPRSNRPLAFGALRFSSGIEGCPPGDMLMGIWNKSSWHPLGERIATLHAAVYKSCSQGSVTLRSPDPRAPLDIRFRLLSDPRDKLRLVHGLRFLFGIMAEPDVAALRNELFVATASEFIRRLNRPSPVNWFKASCAALLLDGPAVLRRGLIASVGADPAAVLGDAGALEEFVFRNAGCMFHPVGTCRIGDAGDRGAVVDARGRVHGVGGLRVVDGSVMPSIVRGNTNLPITMIAEKATDMIKADRASR